MLEYDYGNDNDGNDDDYDYGAPECISSGFVVYSVGTGGVCVHVCWATRPPATGCSMELGCKFVWLFAVLNWTGPMRFLTNSVRISLTRITVTKGCLCIRM